MEDEGAELIFRERMEAAALLPGHDAVRAAVVQEVAARGGEEGPAGREWLALLEEAERLKLGLMTVPVPAGLEQRLLRISRAPAARWWQRPVGEVFTVRRLAMAASVVVLIAAGWWGVMAVGNYREGRAVERLAPVAAEVDAAIRVQAPAARLETSNAAAAEKWLRSRIGFPALMLSGRGTTLTGASVVAFDRAPAAVTMWEKDGHRYTLLEFVPASVGLSADFAKREAVVPASGRGAARKVVIWGEPNQGCGWALVMEAGAENTFTY